MSAAGGRRDTGGLGVARRDGILCRELAGETILLDPEAGTYYALNEVGSRVWELAAERPSVASIRERLVAEYAVDRETVERDLDELLERLAAEGLIELIASGDDGTAT